MSVIGPAVRSRSGGGVLPTGPVTGWERERAGLKRFTTGFLPGLVNLFKDVGYLVPGGKEPELLKELFGTGQRTSALLESYKRTGRTATEFLPSLVPGGKKPSETEFYRRGKGSSFTEAALEDILNVASVAPVVGIGARAAGAGAKAAQLGGVAAKAGQVGRAAQLTATPLRSAASGVLRRAGKEAAAEAIKSPMRAARGALEVKALRAAETPSTSVLPRLAEKAGRVSMGRRQRHQLIEAQRGVGRSQIEAARLTSTAAMRTAATRLVDLMAKAENPISYDDASAIIGRHMQERLTGLGETQRFLNETLEGLGVKPREGPVVLPDDADLAKLMQSAEDAYVTEQAARQVENNVVPDMGQVAAEAEALGARSAKKFAEHERQLRKIEKLQGRLLPRQVERLASLGSPTEATDIAQAVLEGGVTPEAIRRLAAQGRAAPPRRAEALQAQAEATLAKVKGVKEKGELTRATRAVEEAQVPQDRVTLIREIPQMLPVMRETVRNLKGQLEDIVTRSVEEQLLPHLGTDLTNRQLWGKLGSQLMRWAQEGALQSPEARTLLGQIASIEDNIAQLSGELGRGRLQRGRVLGASEERLRTLERQAKTPIYIEGRQVGRLTEQARQIQAAAERPTFEMGRAVERAVEQVRGTQRDLTKAQNRAAREWSRGADLAKRALAAQEDIDKTPITAFPRVWRPMVQGIKGFRSDMRKLVDEGTLDEATAAQIVEGVPDNLTALMKLAADRGIDPVFVREFSSSEAKALAIGAPRVGRGPFVPPGREVTAGVRKASTGARRRAGTQAENIEAFQAAKVELDHERIANQLAAHTETTFAKPIPENRQVPDGWVPWDPRRPFGKIERLTDTESGLRVVEEAAPGAQLMIPREVNNQLRKFSQSMPQSALLGAAERIMHPWRTLLLTLSPRWYINNVIGNVLLATVEGVTPVDWVRAYQALRFEERGGERMRGLNVRSRVKGLENLPEELPADLVGGGIRSEYAPPGRLTNAMQTFVRRKTGGRLNNASISRLNTVMDEFARTAVYMRALRKGASPEQALQRGLKALVDYGDMSPIEREVMRKIIPFYSWQKGILKLTLKLPLDHPYRVAAMAKVGQLFGGYTEEERGQLPEYMLGSVESPWGPEGSRLSLRGVNPFADAFSLASADGILSSLSPLVEIPGRALFNVPEKGYFAERMEVGPIGFARPNVTMWGQLSPFEETGVFRELPQIRAFTTPGALPQLFGATIRTPEQIAKARERLAKGRAMAASSLLPPQPEGTAAKRRGGVLG